MAREIKHNPIAKERFLNAVFLKLGSHTTFHVNPDQLPNVGEVINRVRLIAQVDINGLNESLQVMEILPDSLKEIESAVEEIFFQNVIKDKGCDFTGTTQNHYFVVPLTFEDLFIAEPKNKVDPEKTS